MQPAGSPLHFVGLMVGRGVGVDMLHVPFQGSARRSCPRCGTA